MSSTEAVIISSVAVAVSSMTLFAHVTRVEAAFSEALGKYYPDGEDPLTLPLILN